MDIKPIKCCSLRFFSFPLNSSECKCKLPPKARCSKHLTRLSRRGHNVSVLDTIHANDRSRLIRHIRATLPQNIVTEEGRREFADMFWDQTKGVGTLPEFFGHADNKLGALMQNYPTEACKGEKKISIWHF